MKNMKKNTSAIRTLTALALMLIVAACTENETQLPQPPAPETEMVTFTASLGSTEAETRLSYEEKVNGVTVKWTEDDKLKLFAMDYSAAIGTYTIVEGSIIENGKKATFTGPAAPNNNYHMLFGPADIIPGEGGFGFTFSYLGQEQTGNNTMDHLTNYDFIAGGFTNQNMDNLFFSHLGCLLQFELTNLPAGTYTNFSIKSSVADGILSSRTYSSVGTYIQEFPLKLKDITLNGSNPLTLWLMLPALESPVFKAGTLTLEVTNSSGSTYTNVTPIEISAAGQKYDSGKRYYMTTAMQ